MIHVLIIIDLIITRTLAQFSLTDTVWYYKKETTVFSICTQENTSVKPHKTCSVASLVIHQGLIQSEVSAS